ncbi:xylulokinase [Paenibacillus sp. 1_12]|uniref:xylulokinase n=1 Tax=Paenibacillus sp. 1_12 TaxID=1566278 RepID=UPI0008EE04DA|nr:FGGY-family carbohydrate kinase [Paenibacillus sp. 1_12]SFK94449.1 xylulokinase [Paenibacillus sp. 1_12]
MHNEYLLGIDIGTSGCKIAAFTPDGEVAYQCTEKYETLYPAKDCVEQNPLDWWEAVCRGTQRMFAHTAIQPHEIKGIGVDGQSWSMIPVDVHGHVLRNSMIWMDRRAVEQCEQMKRVVGEERIFAVSGNPLSPSYTTGKILWMKEHEPELYARTHKVLQCNSFIVFKLTGIVSHDLSQGYGIHAFDMRTGAWDLELCDELGIDPGLLPELYGCSDIVGMVSNEASASSGLLIGTPVVAGGLDAACGTLGVGAIHDGETQEQGGQAGGMSIVMSQPIMNNKLILGYHVVSGKWLLQGGTVGGGSLNWFQRELFGKGVTAASKASNPSDNREDSREADQESDSLIQPVFDPFREINEEAAQIDEGSDGIIFLPYMAGERSPIWDIDAKGVFLGLSYATTRGHMARAIMEGCAYSLQHNLLTAIGGGVPVDELYSMGGAANSQLWSQIKADITGKTLRIASSDTATTQGAAMLAGVGTGIYKDFDEAVRRTVRFQRAYDPNPAHTALYEQGYEQYLSAYISLKEWFTQMKVRS